ncbi:GAP family protein [Mycobacterium lentiflavum]|nr:GAP family protein [Mycobacterium lentiflavum]ULP40832.2 GAP family protein [Mycobacterium lentiflavum]
MWSSLVPLVLGSALEPIELVITIMLLGTPSHLRAAGAWVGGHVTMRLLQGLVFGTILHWGARGADSKHEHHWIVSTVLLVVALLFLVTAARAVLTDDDPDAPPSKWMTILMSATPTNAFLIGTGLMTVSVKAWVFTLAAIGVIGNADIGRVAHIVSYIGFVLLAASGNLLIIGLAAFFPQRSRALLAPTLSWLQKHERPITVATGLVFGIWLGIKALRGFGIL